MAPRWRPPTLLAARYSPDQVEAMVLTDGRANVGLGSDPRRDAADAAAVLETVCRVVRVESRARRAFGASGVI